MDFAEAAVSVLSRRCHVPIDSTAQKLDLISQIWDSIPDSPEPLPIPEWHRDLLEQRLADADANPEVGIPWEQVRERLRKRP